MKRNLADLSRTSYDLIVIGGGIYGAWTACDASLRGLKVALLDKGDFGSATSSNTLKIVHGGLRYLQHADFRRMRQSIRERTILMRVIPNLVHPLPFLMPTYGHFMKGKEAMLLALRVNDLIGFDRNSLDDPQKYLPKGRVISREECLELFPGVDEPGLTGGAVWYDCQMYNSERIIISILRLAEESGAALANYAEVTGFLKRGDRITGIKATDSFTQEVLDIHARVVVNAGGPWLDHVLGFLNGKNKTPKVLLSKAMNIVVGRKLIPDYAVGVSSASFRDRDKILNKGSRLLFITPWRECSLIGTTHDPYNGDPAGFRITEKDIQDFIAEINRAHPPASLRREDVSFFHGGLLPTEGAGHKSLSVTKKYEVRDHAEEDGTQGLVSVLGVKYTTARDIAEKTVDLVFKKLEKMPSRCLTTETPLYGGNIGRFEDFLSRELKKKAYGLNARVLNPLLYNYGSQYTEVLKYIDESPGLKEVMDSSSPVMKAEVVHGVREEMAMKLSDVVFRRTELGSAGSPGEVALKNCAEIMARELDWDQARIQRELNEVRAIYSTDH